VFYHLEFAQRQLAVTYLATSLLIHPSEKKKVTDLPNLFKKAAW
jgi:hypothetical protein